MLRWVSQVHELLGNFNGEEEQTGWFVIRGNEAIKFIVPIIIQDSFLAGPPKENMENLD